MEGVLPPMRKAAIENASIDMLEVFDLVSEESRREKKAIPPINKMLYYWTRKPLIVGRTVALACTLQDPKQVKNLLGIGNRRAYINRPNSKSYRSMLESDPADITVLDPFAGTGNLAFPSAELGLDVTCSDYNPLAHLIERASLEIPATYDGNLAKEFEDAANKIIEDVEKAVGHFYTSSRLVYLWAWCIRCTHCGQRVPLLNQMYISKKMKIGYKITPTNNKNFTVDIIQNISDADGKSFTQKHGKAECISCHNTIPYDSMTQDITKNRDKEMLAIQIQKPGRQGRDFILPTKDDRKTYTKSLNTSTIDGTIPTEDILASHRKRNTLWIYGIRNWNEFFNDRQLVVLSTLVQKINAFQCDPHLKLYLSFLVAKFVNCYSYGVLWGTSKDTPVHALTMRRPSIVFNLAEINPFEKVSGSLRNYTTNIVCAIEYCSRLDVSVQCRIESVTTQSTTQYDIIITDPPYGDDVQYGELSEFLYLWVYRALKDSTLPARAPLDEDFCESWGRFGDKKLASKFFEVGLEKSFVSMNKKLKDDGIMAVFFAHSSVQAWNQLLEALRKGSFRVVSSYAIHTENENNPLARDKTSFMSSIVVVCRKITEESSGFIEDIMPDADNKISGILDIIPDSKLYSIPITDILIMVYGKVLEACTKYSKLKSRGGSGEPDFGVLLSNAQSSVMRLLVSKVTKSNTNTIGARMAFYILVKVFQGGKVSSDDLLKIAKAYNIEKGMLDDVIQKEGKGHRLKYLHMTEMDFPAENVARDNIHQQLSYLAYQIDAGKAKQVDAILDGENFMRQTIKQIVSLLLHSINLQKNRGVSMNDAERKELSILQTLGDTMKVRVEGGIDTFQ